MQDFGDGGDGEGCGSVRAEEARCQELYEEERVEVNNQRRLQVSDFGKQLILVSGKEADKAQNHEVSFG